MPRNDALPGHRGQLHLLTGEYAMVIGFGSGAGVGSAWFEVCASVSLASGDSGSAVGLGFSQEAMRRTAIAVSM